MNLFVVRHGETNGNVNNTLDGITDIELNENGLEQARMVREKLKNVKFDIVICSPLKRTMKTMEIINYKNVPVIYDNRLIERDYGEFTGKTGEDLDLNSYWNYYDKTKYEKAESLEHMFNRVYEVIDETREKYKDKNVLFVTHRGVSRAVACYFDGIPKDGNIRNLGLKNCEVKNYIL